MSYLVLARKYRPQAFAEIVGQEHVTRTLTNALARGRVHHAFLFCGARGVGKTTAARCLAKALCCEQGVGVACGACSACRTITDGSAVDYHEIDGASNNGVDDIRELRDGVRYQPAQLKRKIYVIDEVHMLSVAAFNALLKTLEEPPAHVTFIFATTEVHKIPITILSRCQRYDFKLVPTTRLVAHLEDVLGRESITVDKGALQLLAREAGGSVRDALSLTDQVIAYVGADAINEARVAEVLGVADRKLLRDLASAVIGGDVATALGAVEAAADRGVDLAQLARTFLGLLRDLAVVADVKEPGALIDATPDEIAALRALADATPRLQILALFDRFARACEDMARSPAPRLVLEVALIDMAGREPLEPIAELLARLDQIEGKVRSGSGGGAGPSGGAPRPRASVPPAGVQSAPSSSSGPVAAPVAGPTPKLSVVAEATVPAAPAAPMPAAPMPAAPMPAAPMPAAPMPAAPASATVTPAAAVTPAPAPAPAAAQAPGGAPLDPMAEWETIVLSLEKKHMTLAGVYAHARLVSWQNRRIELAFAHGSLQASLGADSDNIAKLKAFLAEAAAGPVDVVVKTVANMPPPSTAPGGDAVRGATGAGASGAKSDEGTSIAERDHERRRAERDKREAEARQHPVTQAALDVFGAAIKEIKVDG